jgi:hypothetical protein
MTMAPRLACAVLAGSLAIVAVAACSSPEDRAAHEGLTIQQIMRDEIDANAHALWAVTNPAIDDQAGLDPNKMTEERWTQMERHANVLKQGALAIARMDPLVVARPGEEISDADIEGGYSAAQVQAAIDEDTQELRVAASSFAIYAALLSASAYARDAPAAGKLLDDLNSQCETCHLEFWYPSQKELTEGAATAPRES